MQGVRIQPAKDNELLVDVVCDCGSNGLKDKITGEASSKHFIEMGKERLRMLICDGCKREYVITAQGNHIHVSTHNNPGALVLFYESPWYCFSNFSSFRVYWRGVDWDTGEHAYQAAKFDNPVIVEEIRNARSAHESKQIAKRHAAKIVPNWNEIELAVMEEIVRAKLNQHSYIQRKLLETGIRWMVEDSPTDSFWGRGPDWKGQNHLGKIWMKFRQELHRV